MASTPAGSGGFAEQALSTSRKKACQNCSKAKVRCSLEKPVCMRCRTRNTSCVYVTTRSRDRSGEQTTLKDTIPTPTGTETTLDTPTATSIGISPEPITSRSANPQPRYRSEGVLGVSQDVSPGRSRLTPSDSRRDDVSRLDSESVDLVCTVDHQRVRNRWMESILPSPGQRPKNLSPTTVYFVSSVFKSYSSMCLSEGSAPPIIHRSQISGSRISEALANCFNLARLMETQVNGSESMVRDILQNEMKRLYERVSNPHFQSFCLGGCGSLQLSQLNESRWDPRLGDKRGGNANVVLCIGGRLHNERRCG